LAAEGLRKTFKILQVDITEKNKRISRLSSISLSV